MAAKVDGFGLANQTEKIAKESVGYLKELFPIIGNRNELHLKDVQVITDKDRTREDEMKIKDQGRTMGDKVRATFELRDKNGKVLDRKKMTAMEVPSVTTRGSFIVKGNEYQVFNQMRLDPAVYNYKDASGEIQSQFNLEKGRNFKMAIDPRTKKFQLKVGTSTIDAYPVMKLLGVNDQAMQDTWGKDLLEANRNNFAANSLPKLYEKLVGKKPTSGTNIEQELKDYFKETRMNGNTNVLTIGQKSDQVDGKSMLAASKRNLAIAAGKEKEDERDDMKFQTIHTAADLVGHRLQHAKNGVQRNIRFKVDSKDSIGNIVNKDAISKPLESFFTQTELASTFEQLNPLHNFVNSFKITRMGEGGIGSVQQITKQARNVHPSQFGFIDPYQTVESSMVGISTDLSIGAKKRDDGRLVTEVKNVRTGKMEQLTPLELSRAVVAFPDQYKNGKPVSSKVEAMQGQKPIKVSPSKVDYVFPSVASPFSIATSMIPFQDSNQGNRKMMAAKQMTQYTQLSGREAPLVQIDRGIGDGKTIEKKVGELNSVIAPTSGIIKKIDKEAIYLKDSKGTTKIPIYKDFYLNQKSYLSHTLKVKEGDRVNKGQLLADSSSTKDGTWAPGVNLRVAYTPYKGKNFEDGVVISESAAKKMTSKHMHKFESFKSEDSTSNKKKFQARFPTAFSKEQLDKLDDDGMLKPGQMVNYGDPIILNMKKRQMKPEDIVLGRVSKKFENPFQDSTETWKYKFPGKVVRTHDGKTKVVRIKTREAMVKGDKIAGRHGNKGIITEILPDAEMPRDKEGNPVDIVLNPQGVIGRINPSQLLETSAGKVAKKIGKPITIDNYASHDNGKWVRDLMKKHNIKEKDELFDPQTGESMGEINTGYQMIMKLDHPVRKKFAARGVGSTYTSEMAPGRGEGGGQSIGTMEVNSLLSHGAKENLREMSTIKSDKNDDFWYKFQSGQPFSLPKKMPFVTQKLFDHLKVLGVDHKIQGKNIQLTPMTDKEVEAMSSGAVTNGRILRTKEMGVMAEKGGLFDPAIFGRSGIDGTRWGHVNLQKRIPNPIFEDAIKGVTGLTTPQFDGLLKGTHFIDKRSGEIKAMEKTASEEKITGPEAIEHLLSNIDRDRDLAKLRREANQTKSQTKRNEIFRKMKYLRGLKKMDATPDIYMTSKVPVLPPQMRSVIPLPDGNLVVSDLNHGYKDLVGVNQALKEDMEIGLGDEQKLTSELYKATKALQGLGSPISYGKDYSGVVDTIKGSRNKTGFFQSKVVKRRQEISGRSTITPNPQLGIDQAGIPEKMAWEIFKPMVKRKMAPFYGSLESKKHIEEKTPTARKFLQGAMDDGYVMLNRAPSLHKGSIMAFKPQLAKGDAIEIPNLVVGPYNADFDGDCYDGYLFLKAKKAIDSNAETVHNNGIENSKKGEDMPHDCFIDSIERIHISKFPHTGNIVKRNDKVEEFEVEPGYQVLSFDHSTKEWKWTDVEKFSIHYNLTHFNVKYKSGRKVNVSEDASLFVIPKERMIPERTRPEDAFGLLSPNPNKMVIDHRIKDLWLTQYNDGEKRRGHQIDKVGLDKDFGWMTGLLTGDGWCNIENKAEDSWPKVCLANSHPNVVEEYTRIIESYFGDVAVTKITSPHMFDDHHSSSEKHTFSSEDIAWYIYKETGKGAYNRQLPSFMLEAPEEFRWGLLSGLMDSDGYFGWSNSKGKKSQFQAKYDTKSERLKDDFCMLCWSLGLRTFVTESRGGYVIGLRSHDVKANLDNFSIFQESKKEALCRLLETDLRFDQTDYLPVTEKVCKVYSSLYYDLFKKTEDKAYFSAYSAWNQAKKKFKMCRYSVERAFNDFPLSLEENEDIIELKKILDSGITFDVVKSIEKQEGKKTMWDLTIPGSFTFLSADGAALFDTMSVHVPVSAKAKNEAERMLPSSMIFNPRDKSLFFAPSQGAVLGLYNMSKKGGKDTGLKFQTVKEAVRDKKKIGEWNNLVTIGGIKAPLGTHMINQALPKEHRDYNTVFDKGGIKKVLERVGEDSPKKYGQVVNAFKDFGYLTSTGNNNTITIEDFSGFDAEKEKQLKIYDQKRKMIDTSRKSPELKSMEINKLMTETVSNLEKAQANFLKKQKNNNAFNMIDSGSRGNQSQVRQVMATPFMVRDFNDNPLDMEMRRGYMQGQSMMESLFSAQSARSGMIKKVSGVSEPGMFAKMLAAVNVDTVVTEKDCGTNDGMDHDPSDCVDRYLAKSYSGIGRRNQIVTPAMAAKAKKKNMKLNIRTQMTCDAKKGVCSLCYGSNEYGKTVEVGDNIGIKDAQSLSEPMTQAAMKEFHTGGLAGAVVQRAQGFDRLKQLYSVTDNLPGHAILAETSGKIQKAQRSPAGGYDITINGKEHYSPSPEFLHKVGDTVKKGQQLTGGYLRPQDVMRLNGREKAQKYMMGELRSTLKSVGTNVPLRTTETIVANQTALGRVISSDHPEYMVGDVTKIKHLEKAKKQGSKIEYEPMVRGVERAPTDDTVHSNLFQDMNFRELKKNIKRSISQGHQIHYQNTVNPIASYLMGNFGKDEFGNSTKLY